MVTITGSVTDALGASAAWSATASIGTSGWNTVKLGGGGFTNHIDIAADGTKVCRNDTYGAHAMLPGQTTWFPLAVYSKFPANSPGLAPSAQVVANRCCYEIRVAPSNTSVFYMYLGSYVYVSTNAGASWNATGFAPVSANADAANQNYENVGFHMAVDPANANICYVGTPSSGVFVTSNAGASFAAVSAIPNASSPGNCIAFNPSGGANVVGGVTQEIYVTSYGHGVYRSGNGGSTWAAVSTSITTACGCCVGMDGKVYVPDGANLNIYTGGASGTWSKYTPTNAPISACAVNPNNASEVVVIDNIGYTICSFNGGSTWSPQQITTVKSSPTVPWLANDSDWVLGTAAGAAGGCIFDPSQSNVLYIGTGVGPVYMTPDSTSTAHWTFQVAGIEQMVAKWAFSPPGGNMMLTAMDRAIWSIADPSIYPVGYGTRYNVGSKVIMEGYAGDYATGTPSTIACISENWGVTQASAYSTNGGGSGTTLGNPSNWTLMNVSSITDLSGGTGAGCIACGSATNWAWAICRGGIWVTQNAGASWTKPAISGVAASGDAGWDDQQYFDRHIIAADRVNTGTFYAWLGYTTGGGGSTLGIYISTNGGVTWTRQFTGEFDLIAGGHNSAYNATLRSVPGQAGNFFFTSGQGANAGTLPFHRGVWNGTTLTLSTVANVTNVFSFGFGAPTPGGDGYPAIYIYGQVSGVWGVWRCDNFLTAQTWTQLLNNDGSSSIWPMGSFDQVNIVEGDMNNYGRCYVGFAGSSYMYYTL